MLLYMSILNVDASQYYGTYDIVYTNGRIETLTVDTFRKYYEFSKLKHDPTVKYMYFLPLEFDEKDLMVETIVYFKK